MSAVLTIAEAATRLRVSLRTLKREIAEGAIATVTIRGCVRILAADLDAYLNARRRTHPCPSVATAKAGRPECSTWGIGLSARLGPGRTRSSTSAAPAPPSPIVELAAHRATRSRKRSTAG